MFIPREYLLANDAVRRVAESLAPDAMNLSKADLRRPEHFEVQHRAISGALDRLLQALSEGTLEAILLDAESGAFIVIPLHVWRSDAGREALWWSKLALYRPGNPDWVGAVVLYEDHVNEWLAPRDSAKVPQSVVDLAALSLAQDRFREHHDKPFKEDIVSSLKAQGYGVKASEAAYRNLPDHLRRAKGEHAARTASQKKTQGR